MSKNLVLLKQQNDCKLIGESLIFDSLTLLLIDDWRV